MHSDLLYQLSLLEVPHIGHVHAKTLCDHFASARDIFQASHSQLSRIEGIGDIRARSIRQFKNFRNAEKEIAFIARYNIRPLFIRDEDYPQRLINCYDPPVLLFYKGNADLNTDRIVSIVGTRRNSEYGKAAVAKLIKEFSAYDILVVSGLAFGIDAIAHTASLEHGVKTVGVVGHGLHMIYPHEHAALARQMMLQGGLLTEFTSATKPDKHNFPSRNRIVAGISDTTIVVESGTKGGSMITAEIAGSYNRDVFAIPGRINDTKSTGCNMLIRTNKAELLNDPAQLIDALGWGEWKRQPPARQQELFPSLTEDEKRITSVLQSADFLHIEEINRLISISAATIAGALLSLEMKGQIQSLPGKRFRILS